MTAAVLTFPVRQEGRPSNAVLQMENRSLRAAVDRMAEQRDEMTVELRTHVSERIAAAAVLDLARRAQRLTGAGYSPASHLDSIERIALREQWGNVATPLDDALRGV